MREDNSFMKKIFSRITIIKLILLITMGLCVIYFFIFFLSCSFSANNCAFSYAHYNELLQLEKKGLKKVEINRKIVSYTPVEFANQSCRVAKNSLSISISGAFFGILIFFQTILIFFLIGKRQLTVTEMQEKSDNAD